jgi:hypothetical protein
MAEEQGQAQEQPDVTENELAVAAADRILDSENEVPKKEPEGEVKVEATEAQPEEGGIEIDLDAKMFEVEETKEGGIKEKVKYSLNELKAQRMMQADYQRKTAELARERESGREQVKQAIDPVVKQYQEQLQYFEKAVWQALAPEMQNTDWNTLAAENPAEWARKMQVVTNVNATLEAIRGENQRLTQAQQQQVGEAQKQQITKARETLQNDIPGWNDEVYRSVLKTGLDYGYSPDEVNAVTDPRAIKVLNDAMKYRALQAAKPVVEKKIVNVPKVLKPGSAEKPDPNRETWKKGMAQLKKGGGKTSDAVELAKLLLQ